MSRALTIGRLFGIRFVVDASWLIMFAVLSWTVSTLLDAYGPTYALGAACAYSLLLFASVVAHELGHALVARSYGVGTSSIALFLFGGVATLEREPDTPEAEIRTAVAGPLVSVGLSLIFAGCARLVDDGIVHDVLSYLALGNAAIAVFNIVPAFPMDGGRMLARVHLGRAQRPLRGDDRRRVAERRRRRELIRGRPVPLRRYAPLAVRVVFAAELVPDPRRLERLRRSARCKAHGMSETITRDYRSTLNLPKTGFPMRADLPKREPERVDVVARARRLRTAAGGATPAIPSGRCTTVRRTPTATCTWGTSSTACSKTCS